MNLRRDPLDNQSLEAYRRQGFTEQQILQAWNATSTRAEFDNRLQSMKQSQSIILNNPQSIIVGADNFDQQIQQAIAASLLNNKMQAVDPITSQRVDRVPCGLKNVGNTCYFNSLLQTYFFNYEFVSAILKWKCNNQGQIVDKRLQITIQLVQHLQKLFVRMIGSDKKFVDPSDVLKSISDDFGNVLPIGDQKDVGEFNHYFLSRIDEGLQYQGQPQVSQSVILKPSSQINQPESSSSQIHNQSMLMRQSSIVSDNSVVQKMFFGKFVSEIVQNGTSLKLGSSDMFNFIQIDVNHKTLTEGFDRYMNQSIEEYRTQENHFISAVKQLWITHPPEVLSFQIQRVTFNKEFNTMYKINSFFHFDQEIFIDRYLQSNSKVTKQIQINNAQLKERLKKIEAELTLLQSFNGNTDIIKNLETTLQFLRCQSQSESQNPYYIDCNDNRAAIQQITSYSSHLIKKRECLLKEQLECVAKVQASYNNLNKCKYVLQSILMHEGNPEAGHYYAYIYNFEQKKWHCFNDMNVTEETPDKVISAAFGDPNSSKSAYLLSYVKDDVARKGANAMIPIRNFRISTIEEKNQYLYDGYGQLLSQAHRDLLAKENQQFKQEIEEIKQQQMAEYILEKYSINFEKGNERVRSFLQSLANQQFKPPMLRSFGLFVKYKGNENMYKWLALDMAVKNFQKCGIIESPTISQNFKSQLLQQLQLKYSPFKVPSNPQPSLQDISKLKDEYNACMRFTAFALFVTEQYINNNFVTALQALQQYTRAVKSTDQKSFFYELAIYLKHQMLLGILCKLIAQQILQESDFMILKLLIAYQMQEHFQYKEPKLWGQHIINLINIIQEYNPLKKPSFVEVTKPIYENRKNIEACQLLDIPCEGLQFVAMTMLQTYQDCDFEGPDEDLLVDTLSGHIKSIQFTKVTNALFDKINRTSTILDEREIMQVIQGCQQ